MEFVFCVINILSGACLGHLITRQYYLHRIAEAIALSKARNRECLALLADLKQQIARYLPKRGADGKFVSKN